MDAIKYVSNEKSEITAVIIDLVMLNELKHDKEDVFKALENLNELIRIAPINNALKNNNWEKAKELLKTKDFK